MSKDTYSRYQAPLESPEEEQEHRAATQLLKHPTSKGSPSSLLPQHSAAACNCTSEGTAYHKTQSIINSWAYQSWFSSHCARYCLISIGKLSSYSW